MSAGSRPVIVPVFHPGLEKILLGERDWSRLEALGALHARAPISGFDTAAAADRLAEARVLLSSWGCPPIDEAALALAPRLELVAHAAGTVKELATDALFERGVRVTSAAAANAVPVAEFTLAAILLTGKDAFAANHRYHADGAAVTRPGAGVGLGNRGKVVGLVGASRVGRLVIERLRPFDLHILLADPYVEDTEAKSLGVELVALGELLDRADVVSLHVPLLPETEGLIDEAELARMKAGATLINTARGRVCDAGALERALVEGRIQAVIDTSDPEPLPDDTPLRGLPNVFLTPHIAGSLGNEVPRMTALAIDEIERFLRGEPLQHEVMHRDLKRIA